ncbi:hypothetical protein [Pseudoxanthomonas jiangsuensis]|uniref:hypothetical protein n=1 Tax=Pseudoxanthomonas jiangsuensis TaxID=619688 RepID=UPI00147912B1|nr:hypothetical protein [Pseudoxanthomonas jiangsuensis]
MRSDTTQRDLYRDDPRRMAELYRIQAETSLRQFPNDTARYQHYLAEAERLEAQRA